MLNLKYCYKALKILFKSTWFVRRNWISYLPNRSTPTLHVLRIFRQWLWYLGYGPLNIKKTPQGIPLLSLSGAENAMLADWQMPTMEWLWLVTWWLASWLHDPLNSKWVLTKTLSRFSKLGFESIRFGVRVKRASGKGCFQREKQTARKWWNNYKWT